MWRNSTPGFVIVSTNDVTAMKHGADIEYEERREENQKR
jgi:hypothetical protein